MDADEFASAYEVAAESLTAALSTSGHGRRLMTLHDAQRRIVEEHLLPQLAALCRVQAALARLGELGPAAEIVNRGPEEAARAVCLDRVLLSRLDDGSLVAEAAHDRTEPPVALLGLSPIRVEYPLIEGEMVRRRQSILVRDVDEEPRRHAYAASLGLRSFVAAPIVIEGRVVGFFHGERLAGIDPITAVERTALTEFASGFATLVERAVLRRRLRDQRREVIRIADLVDTSTKQFSNGVINLAVEQNGEAGEPRDEGQAALDGALSERLTRREADVLKLMAQGMTNAAIARSLVVTEGTVKFHVKNILRKMQATNRADATSRYLRLTLRQGIAIDR